MPYLAIKHLHVSLAVLSVLFYALRGFWLLSKSPKADARWVRIAPHLFYTVLVLAGATLATLSGQWGQTWIWTKLALLVGFVALGAVAFSRRNQFSHTRRVSLWGMGLVLYIMIFAVAAHHHAELSATTPPPGTAPAP